MKELGSLVPFLLIALVFWLLLIRPQRKRALQLDRLQRSLTVGDEVMLGSGFVATVAELPEEGEFLGVELSPGLRVRVARGAIARVLTPVAPDVAPGGAVTPEDEAVTRGGGAHDTEPPAPTTDLTKH